MAGRGRPARERPELCSKCQIYPPTGGSTWCSKCKSESTAAQLAMRLTQAEANGFARGIEAMRETLALEFDRWGHVPVACSEVASAIRQAPRPLYAPAVLIATAARPVERAVTSRR